MLKNFLNKTQILLKVRIEKKLEQSQATTRAIEAIADKLIRSSTSSALANTIMSFDKELKSMAKTFQLQNIVIQEFIYLYLNNLAIFALNKVQIQN